MAFEVGTRAGKFELLHQLGAGGFGLVFLARDHALGRDCAVKFLRPEHTGNTEYVQRFLQEARAAARIQHPGIVTVFECGQLPPTGSAADGMVYISMELLRGEPLSARLSRGPLPVVAAATIARQIASAVEVAHQAGIVHRDLKPENVYLVPDPETVSGERVKVLDFGIAKLAPTSSASAAIQTAAFLILGSPRYMSPEQCRSTARVDARADIYSLGAMLFEMLCGEPPFVDPDASGLMAKHQLVEPARLRTRVAGLPAELDQLVASMLAKAPEARPQTMAAVECALAPFRARTASEESGGRAPAVARPASSPGAVLMTERVLTSAAPSRPPAEQPGRPAARASSRPPAETPARASPTEQIARPRSRVRRWVISVVVASVILAIGFATRRSRPPREARSDPDPFASIAPTPQELRNHHRAAGKHRAAAMLDAMLAPAAFAMGPDATELAYGAPAARALIERHVHQIPIGPLDAPLGREGNVAWWIEIGSDRRVASSALAVAAGPQWRIAAWKLSHLVDHDLAAKLATAGKLPAPAALVRAADPAGATLAAELAFRAALSSRAAFIEAFSTRGDAVVTGTEPGELMIGGGRVHSIFSAYKSELLLRGDVATGPLTDRAAWAVANIDWVRARYTTQIFRVFALLLKEGDRWTIVLAHFSNAGPIGKP
jgi:serine/threonine-protein kinase